MARTYLSILTYDLRLEIRLKQTINSTNYSVGFSGNNEHNFIDYLKKNGTANHILFVKPTLSYQSAYNETNLRNFAQIDIVIIGTPLTEEQIGIAQASKISGYITELDIDSSIFEDIINQLYRKNYYSNNQIPESFWINNPKARKRLPQPSFTLRQKEVLFWLCHGFTQNDISQIINTGVSNVENHINRIKSKIYVSSSIEVVALSINNGWVRLSKNKFKRHTPFS